jgi:hypothetical protein
MPSQADAPRPNQDPRIHRDEVLAQLASSGRDTSAPRVGEIVNSLRSLRSKFDSDGVRLSDATCYKGGCVASVTFADEAAFHKHDDAMANEARSSWSGPGFLSGPEHLSDGSIARSLVLFTEEQKPKH